MTKDNIVEIIKPIIIGEVLNIIKHPNADKLLIVNLNIGTLNKNVITGANNFKIGDLVAYLSEGNVVPGYLIRDGKKIILQKKMLRGIESDSMILSADEIGISDDHSGIYIINPLVKDEVKTSYIGKSILDVLTDSDLDMILNSSKSDSQINLTKSEIDQKKELINSVGEEIIGFDELEKLLTSNKQLITYDGFEPSGQMHIAQGIQRAINVNKMIKAGFKFKMLVADWYGYLNNKMGGDINKIKTVGSYFIEIWRASGMDLDNVEFVWTADIIKDPKYWELVMKIAKSSSLKRILKTTQIMGRSENDDLSASQIFYPCMQVADIFMLGAQVTQLGMDQRKVNMLAREIGEELGFWKPIVVNHHMLKGLGSPITTYKVENYRFLHNLHEENVIIIGGYEVKISFGKEEVIFRFIDISKDKFESIIIEYEQLLKTTGIIELEKKLGVETKILSYNNNSLEIELKVPEIDPLEKAIATKMSKSIPDSAIFTTDSREEIQRKITKAYCPEGVIEGNPILEYCKYLIFEAHYLKQQENLIKDGFIVKRDQKYGGDIIYKSYMDLENDFKQKKLFPLDLKNAVIEYIDLLIKPIRLHFINNKVAAELISKVKQYQVTR